MISFGNGSEKSALTDPSLFTTNRDGMDAWERSMVHYVLPLLEESFDAFLNQIEDEAPDRIITTAQGYWGSLSGERLQIPWTTLHLYPQLMLRAGGGPAREGAATFAQPLERWLEQKERELGLPERQNRVHSWSISDRTACAHDPSLPIDDLEVPLCGFPYWDEAFGSGRELEYALEFLDRGNGRPTVAVCLGSYIGLRANDIWDLLAQLGQECGLQLLLVGAGPSRERLRSTNVLAVSHIQMSKLMNKVDFVMHHGGIGVTYGTLQSGVPAIVVPFAFDQSYNARILERARVGVTLSPLSPKAEWSRVIFNLIRDQDVRTRAKNLSSKLVNSTSAAINLAHALA